VFGDWRKSRIVPHFRNSGAGLPMLVNEISCSICISMLEIYVMLGDGRSLSVKYGRKWFRTQEKFGSFPEANCFRINTEWRLRVCGVGLRMGRVGTLSASPNHFYSNDSIASQREKWCPFPDRRLRFMALVLNLLVYIVLVWWLFNTMTTYKWRHLFYLFIISNEAMTSIHMTIREHWRIT